MQLINDSNAVKKMATDTEQIIKELEQSLKSVEQEISSINTRWKDQNYLNSPFKNFDRKAQLRLFEEPNHGLFLLHFRFFKKHPTYR